jgi:hypothetical protein
VIDLGPCGNRPNGLTLCNLWAGFPNYLSGGAYD